MDDSRYDPEWLRQKAEQEGQGSVPRRISPRARAPTRRAWISCLLLVGLVVALAWTLKVAVGH
jgi:hypothetical protein